MNDAQGRAVTKIILQLSDEHLDLIADRVKGRTEAPVQIFLVDKGQTSVADVQQDDAIRVHLKKLIESSELKEASIAFNIFADDFDGAEWWEEAKRLVKTEDQQTPPPNPAS